MTGNWRRPSTHRQGDDAQGTKMVVEVTLAKYMQARVVFLLDFRMLQCNMLDRAASWQRAPNIKISVASRLKQREHDAKTG